MPYRIHRTISGHWFLAFGDEFPSGTDAEGIPLASRFVRTDLTKAYLWNSVAWVEEPGSGGAGPGSLTISEVDGVPLEAAVTDIQIDDSDGLILTVLGAGSVRIDLANVPQARITSLVGDLAARELAANKGIAGGYAALDGGGTVPDAQLPAAIARDAEVTAAIAAHEAAGDPHTGYQKESEKDAASGYAGLSAGSKLAGAQQTYGAAVNTACEGNDARLSDARTPTAHSIIGAQHNGFPGGGTTFLRDDGAFAAPPGGGGGDNVTVNGAALVDADFDDATPAPPAGEINVKWQKDAGSPANVSASVQAATTAVKGVVELATDGEAAANVAVQGNDARMANARTPTAHATSHQNGGSDEVSVVGLSGLLADAQTPLAHAASHNGGADPVTGRAPAGGAAGKVLKKIDATDYNYSWQDDLTGGGGGGNFGEATITLGSGLVYKQTVTGQAWVTAGSLISATVFADGISNTIESVAAAGLSLTIANLVVGDGFDIYVYNPHGLTGDIDVHFTGS